MCFTVNTDGMLSLPALQWQRRVHLLALCDFLPPSDTISARSLTFVHKVVRLVGAHAVSGWSACFSLARNATLNMIFKKRTKTKKQTKQKKTTKI